RASPCSAGLRGDRRRAAEGVGVCPQARGDPTSGAGLADGRRGGRVLESLDSIPDFKGETARFSLATAEEAIATGAREGAAAGRAMGYRPDADSDSGPALLPADVYRRVLALPGALRAFNEHGGADGESRGAAGDRGTASRK